MPPLSVDAALLVQQVDRPGCGVAGSNSVELASSRPQTLRANSIDRALHAEADAEERHLRARGRSGSPRSCPRCRGCRSRRAPGCRRRRRRSRAAACALRSPRSRCRRRSTAQSLAMPPWISASLSDLYESAQLDVLADERRSAPRRCGFLIRCDDALPARRCRGAVRPDVEQLDSDVVEPFACRRERHLVDASTRRGRR